MRAARASVGTVLLLVTLATIGTGLASPRPPSTAPPEERRMVRDGVPPARRSGAGVASDVPAPETTAEIVTVDDRDFSGAENAMYAPDEHTVYVAYKRFLRSPYDPGGDYTPAELCVARSTDGGQTWTVTVLDPDAPEAGDVLEQSVSIGGDGADAVFVAYLEQATGAFDDMAIRVARSTDGGQTWATKTIARRGGEFQALKVVDASTLFLAANRHYQGSDQELRLYRSVDGGVHWSSSRVDLGADWYLGLDRGNAGRIWLSFYDGGTTNLHVATSTSPTGPWTKRRAAGTASDPHYTGLWSELDLSRGVVYLAFEDLQPSRGQSVIRVLRSADDGATWTRSVVDAAWGAGGKIALHVVGDQPPGPARLFLTYWYLFDQPELWGRARAAVSTDGGQTWSVWTVPEPGYVRPYVDAAVPVPGVEFVSYQVVDADTGLTVLRVARLGLTTQPGS